jgi:hypothetical protein
MPMKTPLPTLPEIEELVAFLPRLYAQGFVPVKQWHGGIKREDGVYTMPWPEYDELVNEFFRAAASECWLDYDYRPEDAYRMLADEDFVKNADLNPVKTMLTYCVRGERFSDGHWGEMIEGGHVRRLLQRLAELGSIKI